MVYVDDMFTKFSILQAPTATATPTAPPVSTSIFSDPAAASALRSASNTSESEAMAEQCRESKSKVGEYMPSKPSDAVIAALHDFIREERKRNFFFLGRYSRGYRNPEELLVLNRADPDDVAVVKQRSASLETTSPDDWYTFTELIGRGTRTVAVSMPNKHDGAIESILIGNDAHHMIDAATWMRSRYCTDPDDIWAMKFTEMQYEEHRMWWEDTGKTFKFLDLPSELRIEIYLHIIGRVIVPDVITQSSKQRLVFGVGQSSPNMSRAEHNRDPEIQRPDLAIMLVNKQVREEAMAVAKHDTLKRFTTIYSLKGRGPKTRPSVIWNNAPRLAFHIDTKQSFLRHVQLEMNAYDYFVSIGIHPQPGNPLARCPADTLNLNVLHSISSLQTLDLRFVSPKHKLARCPWSHPQELNLTHSCQKKWIDIFLIFAWDTLHALKISKNVKISLSGCIKDSTRTAWQCLLNDSRADHTLAIKLWEKDVKAAKTDNEPLPCDCTYSCADDSASKLKQFADHEDARLGGVEGWQDLLDKAYWDFEN